MVTSIVRLPSARPESGQCISSSVRSPNRYDLSNWVPANPRGTSFVSSVLTFELGCCPWNHQVLYSAGHRPWSTGHIGHVLGNAPAFYSFCRKLVLNLSRPADLKPGSVGSYCSRLWHPCSSEGTWRCRLVSDPLATSLHPFATGSFTQLRFLRSSWPVGYS